MEYHQLSPSYTPVVPAGLFGVQYTVDDDDNIHLSIFILDTPLVPPSLCKVLSKFMLKKYFLIYQKVLPDNLVITF